MLFPYKMIFTLLIVAALLAGCSPAVSPVPAALPATQKPQPTPEEPAAVQPEPTETVAVKPPLVETPMKDTDTIPMPEDPAMKAFVTAARDDLAQRIALPVDQISLVELSSVTWSDGSLGCPKPGMMYTQALVDGTLIRFRAGEKIYEYHSGGNRAAFYCENPSKALPSGMK